MDIKNFKDEIAFVPYRSVGDLSFDESEEYIKQKLGDIKQEHYNFGGSKTIIFNDLDDVSVYFDDKNHFYGIHFFKSITITLNGKKYDINFDNFTENNLNDISDDFIITGTEEGTDYTSEKLGIDFYFSDDNYLVAVLFMSKEYYKNEV